MVRRSNVYGYGIMRTAGTCFHGETALGLFTDRPRAMGSGVESQMAPQTVFKIFGINI
jgi:hypothetical protein